MTSEEKDYLDKKFNDMEAARKADHIEAMKYLQELIIEQFKIRIEVTQLAKRG